MRLLMLLPRNAFFHVIFHPAVEHHYILNDIPTNVLPERLYRI